MNELSLFTGAGGGLLGTKLLGWKAIGYVEKEPYCQKVIRQRIADGILDAAPIFGDIRKFISDGYAAAYTGLVDVVTGGFPCQPFSVAGQQRGADDPRNMWPATIECIRIIRPQIAFLENVPGLLTNEYIRTIFGDLAEAGYHARWCVLGADDCGCCHRRKRVWIVAHRKGTGAGSDKGGIRDFPIGENRGQTTDSHAPDTEKSKCELSGRTRTGREGFTDVCFDAPDSSNQRLQGCERPGSHGEGQAAHGSITERNNTWDEPWFEVATRLCRVDDAVASRVDRLKALGNGQVSVVAATAFKILTRDLN